MKKWKKQWWWLPLVTYPIWLVCAIVCVNAVYKVWYEVQQTRTWGMEPYGKEWWLLGLLAAGLAVLPSAWIAAGRWMEYRNGRRDFDSKNQKDLSMERLKVLYPDVPEKYLSAQPEGFIFGKDRTGKYIRIEIDPRQIMHCILIGDPGSGKSAGPLLSTLIANFSNAKPPLTVFAMDLKPELAKKSVPLKGNKYVRIFNIEDRSSWGIDLLYLIDAEAFSEDEILRVLTDYAEVLMESSNEKHAFFYDNAKNIFRGAMLYEIKYRRKAFIDAVNVLGASDISAYIGEILTDQRVPEESRVRSILKKYDGKDAESFQDITSTLQQRLDTFSDAEVIWHLRDNPLKLTPLDLEKGISIFVSIPEYLLEHYSVLIRMIVKMMLAAFVRRPEGSAPICMILDKFPRYGKLAGIANGLATLRSRGVSIWLAIQDLSQLQTVYSEAEARMIVNLCSIKACMSTSDVETAKMFAQWTGEFMEQRKSYQRSSLTHMPASNEQISREHRDVMTVADAMSLRGKKEVILYVEGRYLRFSAIRYYEDSKLNRRYEELMQMNQQLDDKV